MENGYTTLQGADWSILPGLIFRENKVGLDPTFSAITVRYFWPRKFVIQCSGRKKSLRANEVAKWKTGLRRVPVGAQKHGEMQAIAIQGEYKKN